MTAQEQNSAATTVIIGEDGPSQSRLVKEQIPISRPTLVFLGTTLAGCIFEIAGSTLGACLSMLAYLGYGFVSHETARASERFADSAYYQGFILTLFALLLALTGKGASTLTSAEIIGKFGLAIWTTFIGMTGRILIIQFLTTGRDQDERARESLSQYIDELNREMEASLGRMKAFHKSVMMLETELLESVSQLSEAQRRQGDAILDGTAQTVSSAVSGAAETLSQSVSTVAERITRLELPPDTLYNPFQSLANRMASEADPLRTELAKHVVAFTDAVKDGATSLAMTRTDLEQLQLAVSQGNKIVSETTNDLANGMGTIRDVLASTGEAIQNLEALGGAADTVRQKLAALLGALDERGRSYGDDLDEVSRRMVAAAKEVGENADALATAIAQGADKLAVAVNKAGDLR